MTDCFLPTADPADNPHDPDDPYYEPPRYDPANWEDYLEDAPEDAPLCVPAPPREPTYLDEGKEDWILKQVQDDGEGKAALPVRNDEGGASQLPAAPGSALSAERPALEPDHAPAPWHGPHWTSEKRVAFLNMLASTHNVAGAARSVGMSRQSAYRLRARMKGTAFDRAWTLAISAGFDALAHAALDRALNGVEVPHYHKGELIGTSRRYDERLTIALLAMRHALTPPRAQPGDWTGADWNALLDQVGAEAGAG